MIKISPKEHKRRLQLIDAAIKRYAKTPRKEHSPHAYCHPERNRAMLGMCDPCRQYRDRHVHGKEWVDGKLKIKKLKK